MIMQSLWPSWNKFMKSFIWRNFGARITKSRLASERNLFMFVAWVASNSHTSKRSSSATQNLFNRIDWMLSHLSLMYFLKSRPMIFEYLFDADSSNGFYDVVVLENIHIIKIVALISLRKNPRHQRRRGLFYCYIYSDRMVERRR